MSLYNDGYYGICESCGADGFWEEIGNEDDEITIRCECGQEEVIVIKTTEPDDIKEWDSIINNLGTEIGKHFDKSSGDVEDLIKDVNEKTKDEILRQIFRNPKDGLKILYMLSAEHAKIRKVGGNRNVK